MPASPGPPRNPSLAWPCRGASGLDWASGNVADWLCAAPGSRPRPSAGSRHPGRGGTERCPVPCPASARRGSFCCWPHLTDEEAEARHSDVAFPRSRGQDVACHTASLSTSVHEARDWLGVWETPVGGYPDSRSPGGALHEAWHGVGLQVWQLLPSPVMSGGISP